MKQYWKFIGLVSVVAILAAGCAQKGIQGLSAEDTPVHHYLVGMELIDDSKLSDAKTHFDRALALEPDYAPALAGNALVAACYSESQEDASHRSVDVEKAIDLIEQAEDEADGAGQKFSTQVTAIRVYSHAKPKEWLKNAQDAYDTATVIKDVKVADIPYYRSREAADYFMGIAAYRAYQFRDAEDLLSQVTQAAPPGRWHEPAAILFKKVHKIVRAMANYTLTDVAKHIAIKDEVVRADVAALLVDELRLDSLMAGRIPKPQKQEKEFIPADIINSPFKNEIQTTIKWHLRGLEPKYDDTSQAYLFNPEAPVQRKELAFILEDLLIKITGEEGLSSAYFGQTRSPFPDVDPAAPWYNAVMNSVSRSLMEPELSGAFRPDDSTDGAEMLLALMRLRNVMNIY